jgi:hypothetical protein
MDTDTKAKTKKRQIDSNVRVGGGGMNEDELRDWAQDHPEQFAKRSQEFVDKGVLRWGKVRDLKRLFWGLSDVQVPADVEIMGQTRAIQASAFPLLAGAMTIAGFNEAYEATPTIGEQLVTDMEDNKKVTIVASISSEDSQIDRVDEGKDFPEIGAGEEKYEIRHKRNGRRLSITGEAIEENDVAGIVGKIDALSEIASEQTEEQTLRRVCDIDGSDASSAEPYVLRLNGSGTQLYNATAANPGARAASGTRVNNNALADGTDLENARVVLAAMLNSRDKRIAIPMSRCQLVVPDALLATVDKITGSELEPGVENELNPWGPRGRHRPRVVSSPKLDDLSTSAWYLGDFQRQFKRKWKLQFEYVTLSGDTQAFLQSRIAFQARIAWDMEVGAVDYVYVVQSIEGTTAPTA